MSTLEGAQGRENGLILGAQNLIALGIDPNDSNAKAKILDQFSREYRAEKKRGNTNLTYEGWVTQRVNTIGDGLAGGAGLEPVLEGNTRAKTQDEIDYDAANGLFDQDRLAEDSYTAEDRDSVGKTRKANPNNVAGFYVRDGQSVEKKAQELERAAEYSDDQEFIDRVARFREDAKLQSYGLKAAEDGSTYASTDEPTLVDIQNTVTGNPHLNQELQGRQQRERDVLQAQQAVAQDNWLGRSSAQTRGDNALSSFLESRLLRNQQRQDDEFVNTIRAIRGLGPEPVRTNVEDLGGGGVLDTNYGRSWEVSRSAVPGLRGESAYVDSVSGEPVKTTANTPDSAQAINAPQPSRADKALHDFISPRLFDSSMDRMGNPTAYRDVNISQVTNDFYRRLGKTPIKGAPLIDSFQEELRDVARKQDVFYDDPIKLDDGTTYRPAVGGDTGRPKTINSILNSLGYEPYEKDQLANALFQELTATRQGNATTEARIAFGDNNNIQYGRPSIDFRQTEGRTIYRDDNGDVHRIPGDDLKAAQERIIGSIPGNYTRPSTGRTVFRQEPYETRRVYLNKETGKGYTPREAMQRAEATGRDTATARRIGTDNASLRRDQKRTEESTALRKMLGQGTILAPSRNPNITGNPRTTRPNSFWPGLGASGGAAPSRNAEDTAFFSQAATRNQAISDIHEGIEKQKLAELVRQGKLDVPTFRDSRLSRDQTPPAFAALVDTAVRQKNAQEARGFTPTAIGGAEPPANTTPLPSAVQPVQNGGIAAIPDTTPQQAPVPNKPNPGAGPITSERRRRSGSVAEGVFGLFSRLGL